MDKNKVKPIVLRMYEELSKDIDYNIVHFVSDAQGIYIADNDPNTNFYFKVSYSQSFLVEKIPASSTNVGLGKNSFTQKTQIVEAYTCWQDIIRDYQAIPKTLQIKDLEASYYEEFLSNVELLDDDAQTAPFDFAKQMLLAEYCHITREKLSKFKERTNENKQEIDEIITDINSLEKNIPKLTKTETVKKVFRIWAKVRKLGFGLFKNVAEGLLIDFAKDGVVRTSQIIHAILPTLL